MAATNAPAVESSEELAAKVAHKRFEGLVMVRTKAIKGKGAWYWAHLEPILVHNSDTGLPKAVKLRCSLCDAVFSASNPSRTASEHLKRGTCPNFASAPKPISSVPSSPPPVSVASPPPPHNHRKRNSASCGGGGAASVNSTGIASTFPAPLTIVDPSKFTVDLSYPPPVVSIASSSATATAGGGGGGSPQLVLSGGKEDLGALAMLEDSVKRLKSPKSWPGPTLNKAQIEASFDLLAYWIYECFGGVALSAVDHPKFKAFLNQVGLPAVSKRELTGARLDGKYEEAKAESEEKIRDAMFFQIAADGWKSEAAAGGENVVHICVNLPNGTNVFRKAVFTSGYAPSEFAEEILWDTITEICGSTAAHQCVGIVSDRFKAKALRILEDQHRWMVNISCQYQGFISLIKDFGRALPLFKNVTDNCVKLATFVNKNSQIRLNFHKYQLQEYGHASLLRLPLRSHDRSDFGPVCVLIEDILSSARALQLVFMDESFKMVLMEEPIAREIDEMRRNPHFWTELEAVHSLIKLIKGMCHEIETEKPRIGQCLPLWEELRVKIKEWCSKFHIVEGGVEKIVDRRFKKNYHPSWAAAFILDPLYLIRDASGKYLPPFKCLTSDQEKDVDKLITRLVSRDEAHIALMELMKWRTEGLDPVYAQAVQLKQRDPNTGKMKLANPQSSRLVWETYLTEFKSLGKVAVRLIFLNATSCGSKRAWPMMRWAGARHSRAGMERMQKMMFIAAHSKMERREVSNDDDKDAELFALENGEDDVLNEVFVDTSAVSI